MPSSTSDLKPPYLQPVVPTADQLYQRYYHQGVDSAGNAVDPVTRNLCLVALSAVGRCGWAQSSGGLVNARAGIYDWSSPVCCWASVIFWAGISAALTHGEVEAFLRALRASPGVRGEVDVAKAVLWDGVAGGLGRTRWDQGARMPLGAMVFMGSEGTQLHHVGLHVGEGYVVGACSPSPGAQVNDLMNRGLSPFTTILPVKDIMQKQEWTYFTNDAFWKGWILQ